MNTRLKEHNRAIVQALNVIAERAMVDLPPAEPGFTWRPGKRRLEAAEQVGRVLQEAAALLAEIPDKDIIAAHRRIRAKGRFQALNNKEEPLCTHES